MTVTATCHGNMYAKSVFCVGHLEVQRDASTARIARPRCRCSKNPHPTSVDSHLGAELDPAPTQHRTTETWQFSEHWGGGRPRRGEYAGSMERIGDKVISRAEITDAASATFADSTVIPDRYARPDEVRDGVVVGSDESYELPVVDMARLLHPEFSEAEIAKLGSACRDWGFFQLTNHGVDETVVQDMKDNTLQFFGLPLEKKKAVAIQSNGFEGFGHHYNRASSEKLDWAESLILATQQHEQRNNEFWPADPSTFRDALDKYSMEMSNLTSRLTVFMASDLGVEQEALMGTFQGKTQSVAFHYYPPCRHPDKVIGITPHHDGLGLTLLLHVDDTPGLQVRKNGRWYPLNPLPGAFLINVGDILQILTNGTYKSAEHRVLPDVEKGRATVVMFQNACVAGMVKPLPELGEATYKAIDHVGYVKGNFRALAEGTRFVDSLKIM